MNIVYKNGNLLESGMRAICHGCNAQGVMRSGIANQIRDRWSKAYDDYYGCYLMQGRFLYLGQVIRTNCSNITIFNAITQKFYGRDKSIVYADYDAIRKIIKTLNLSEFDEIGFPQIGAGLANGDWSIISKIIEEESTFTPVVYVYG